MPNLNLLAKILLAILFGVSFAAFLWWRESAELGYCQTPQQTCINREGIAVGEPCKCHGGDDGVFGLDSAGKVVPER
jgi:hypothetical protein